MLLPFKLSVKIHVKCKKNIFLQKFVSDLKVLNTTLTSNKLRQRIFLTHSSLLRDVQLVYLTILNLIQIET